MRFLQWLSFGAAIMQFIEANLVEEQLAAYPLVEYVFECFELIPIQALLFNREQPVTLVLVLIVR